MVIPATFAVLASVHAWSDTTITTHDGQTFTLPIEPSDIVAIEPIRGTVRGLPPPSKFKPGLSIKRGEDGRSTSNLAPSSAIPRVNPSATGNTASEVVGSPPSGNRSDPTRLPQTQPVREKAKAVAAGTRAPEPATIRELPSQPGIVFPLESGEPVPSLAKLAAQTPRGGWMLVPAPISRVLHKREDMNRTTWGKSGSKAVVSAWSGWAWDGNCGYIHNGGHADYGGNEVYRFCFGDGWKRVIDTYILPERTPENACPQPTADEHGPRSSHTYDQIIWSPKTQSVFYFNNRGYCKNRQGGGIPPGSMVWEFKKNAWNRRRDLDFNITGTPRTALDANNNIVIVLGDGLRVLDPEAGKYLLTRGGRNRKFGSMIYVPELKKYFAHNNGGLLSLDDQTFAVRREVKKTKPNVSTGMAWHSPSKQLVFWDGGRGIRLYDPDSQIWTSVQSADGAAPAGKRPLSKWVYVPAYDVFVGLSRHDDGIWLYRLPPLG